MEMKQESLVVSERKKGLQFRPPAKIAFAELLASGQERTVSFFRQLLTYLAHRAIEDFHLSLSEDKNGFRVDVYYGQDFGPLRRRDTCISCDIGNDVSKCSLLKQTKHHRLWIDAKCRPTFVTTPVDHVEHMSQLDDDALFAFWADSHALLVEEYERVHSKVVSASAPEKVSQKARFLTMVVNHGTYRNLSHLHLKLRLAQQDFDYIRDAWPAERVRKFAQLVELASDRAVFASLIGGSFAHQIQLTQANRQRLTQSKGPEAPM